MFITAFKSARHLSLSRVSSIQSIPPHPTSWRFILILPSHLRLGLPKWSQYQNSVYASLLPRTRCMSRPSHSRFITRKILGEQYRLSSSLCSFLKSLVTSSLSPQQLILKHPQPTVLPQYKRPSFTPIQNSSQNYSSVYLHLYIFGLQTWGQKILHRMVASISCLQSALNIFLNRTLST